MTGADAGGWTLRFGIQDEADEASQAPGQVVVAISPVLHASDTPHSGYVTRRPHSRRVALSHLMVSASAFMGTTAIPHEGIGVLDLK